MNFYVLIRGWQFLSLPFNCLRLITLFQYTLKLYLGTLTTCLGSYHLEIGAFPLFPTQGYFNRYSEFFCDFGNLFPTSKIVLYHLLQILALCDASTSFKRNQQFMNSIDISPLDVIHTS
jgi:hypothetical protein